MAQFSVGIGEDSWGIVTEAVSCDSVVTYITTIDGQNPDDTTNAIYLINPLDQNLTYNFVCDIKGPIFGAAAANEFLASDCTLRLDLDADNSSGAIGSDWQAPILCSGNMQMLSDTDATWYSGYHTDSMRVRLLAPAPDAPQEYLSATPSGSVSVAGQGTTWLTLNSVMNTAVPVSNTDFQNVVRSLRWHDDALPHTPGLRTVEVIAFGSGARRDTAYAFLEVPVLLSAGIDTSFSACADEAPFGLFSPGGAMGGTWSNTVAGAGVFSPQTDPAGVYNYTVDNGFCPADTAQVNVSLLPLPVFSLGQDTSVCSGGTLSLSAPGNALWQDGTSSGVYNVAMPGIYWAEYTGSNGCRFRDSLGVSFNLPVHGQSSVQQCTGQTYTWNGQPFVSDTNVCATFALANGCDSVHCLSLKFYYPTVSLDTSLCSDYTLSWLGKTYGDPGVYQDTVLLAGCWTITHLNLVIFPTYYTIQPAVICAGEAYSFAGQSFTASGQYTIPVQSIDGCDSILILNLSVKEPVQSGVSASICPESDYLFDGVSLSQPGMYAALFQTAEGCDSTVLLTLSFWPAPSPQITGDSLFCNGSAISLDAGNYAAYQWSQPANNSSINISSSGTYIVTVTDLNGCTGMDSFEVIELPEIDAAWSSADPRCHGSEDGFIELSATSGGIEPLTFTINGDPPSSSGEFANLSAGMHTLTISDSLGCTAVFDLTLEDPPALAVELGATPTLDFGALYPIPVQVNQAGVFTYSWSPPTGLDCSDCPNPVVTAGDSIVYSLLLTNEAGCEAKDSLLILVRKGEGIYIPQIFSPNGDGKNESFTVYGDETLVQSVGLFRIFDRWGELVFERESMAVNDEDAGWDGTLRGRPLLPGVYVWYAEIKLLDGTTVFKRGEVTLVR